jgi:hypothetical protein
MTAGNVPIGEFSGGLAGRAGHIIYREPPRELQIYWEMAIHKEQDGSRSYGVTVTCDFQYWSNPRAEPISELHQLEILIALREWLRIRGKRSDIDLPHDLSEEHEHCLWKGCNRNRIRNYYYCREHFDLSSLARIR